MRLDLERQFIKRYVLKAKQDRYLGFVENPKRRGTFLGMLYHGQDLDKNKLRQATSESRAALDALLTTPAYSNCYIISVDSELDGQEMATQALLQKIGAYAEGTVLLIHDVVYYMGEPPHNEYLSL